MLRFPYNRVSFAPSMFWDGGDYTDDCMETTAYIQRRYRT